MEPVPEVGLGAGDSAAMAEPIRAQTATRTRIREAFERPIAANPLSVLFFFGLKDGENVCAF
ncbi:hypothetical protein PVK06_013897 [Gossypium arboreum]|uniref:Uncharacterized protein n=1 Tax=Gossypium arboreum TaxID=29729 RepID=A0ABR0PTK5_GOSAR|nr:hypothetical protein PVK06_013897 [Gossypium arboreum]